MEQTTNTTKFTVKKSDTMVKIYCDKVLIDCKTFSEDYDADMYASEWHDRGYKVRFVEQVTV